MDIFAMLQNAVIVNAETGEPIGESLGFSVAHGRMKITAVLYDTDEEEDPDDGAKDDIPDDDASRLEFPKIVAMGKKTGTDDG